MRKIIRTALFALFISLQAMQELPVTSFVFKNSTACSFAQLQNLLLAFEDGKWTPPISTLKMNAPVESEDGYTVTGCVLAHGQVEVENLNKHLRTVPKDLAEPDFYNDKYTVLICTHEDDQHIKLCISTTPFENYLEYLRIIKSI